MTVFGDYAQFYDDFYQEKDYSAECDFLERVFRKFSPEQPKNILDLGCGTGGHVLRLAQRGYQVLGVDQSAEMLAKAGEKAFNLPGIKHAPEFIQEDVRNLRLDRTFDAIISMFAVMSYMTTNDDLKKAFQTARRHLRPGGLFIFDAWFGPAVLAQNPSDRYKIVERDGGRVIRFAHPELDLLQHTVKVHYRVLELHGDHVLKETKEIHAMRFLFPQEIAYYLNETGFNVHKICPFLHLDDDLSKETWNVMVVAEAG